MATVTEEQVLPQKWVGKSVKPRESYRLIHGKGKFLDDIKLPNMLYAAILRSPYAHAKIVSIDTSKASALPGVISIITGEDVEKATKPFMGVVPPPGDKVIDYCLAVGKTRYAGEPVAAVAATERSIAEDAIDLIEVEYDPLPVVVDVEKAMNKDSTLVQDAVGSNIVWHKQFNYGDYEKAASHADTIVTEKLHFHRFGAAPMETDNVIANYQESTGLLTINCNNQMPMFCLALIVLATGWDSHKIRIITNDIGGGFGAKIISYTYMVLISLLSKKCGRPVKWVMERRANIISGTHANEATFYVDLALKKDGTILGINAKTIHDEGAYLRYEPIGALLWIQVSSGPYRFKNLRMDVNSVVTNKGPVAPIRGYGRMQHLWMIERIIEIAAKQLKIDPLEIRMKNFITSEEMPYVTPSGATYDSGDYPQALEKALEMIGYPEWKKKQAEFRKHGRLIGIGIGTGIDSGTNNFAQVKLISKENPFSGQSRMAFARMDEFGRFQVAVASNPHGQSHETVVSQVVADEFGVKPDDVFVLPGMDSFSHPFTGHSGSYASQFAVSGIEAVLGASRKLKKKITEIAAFKLGATPEDIILKDGKAIVQDSEKSLEFWMIANMAWRNNLELPPDMEPGLMELYCWKGPFKLPDEKERLNSTLTYSYQTHVAVIEIDPETGKVQILKYVAVDDCGTQLNPQVVEGQVHGAAMNGIAASIFEECKYDDSGQLLSSTFMDYLFPTAVEIPHFQTGHLTSPSPFTTLGTKGAGEGGGTPLITLSSAIEDALAPFGIKITDSHTTPERIYNLIKKTKKVKGN